MAQQHLSTYFLEAMEQRQKGNSTAVFDLLTHCVEIDPNAAEAYFYLAQYYLALKDKATAQEYFKKASELNPHNSTYAETLARSYASNGQYDEAIEAFEQIMETDRTRDDILEILVSLYEQQGNYGNAIRTIERMEELDGKSTALTYAKSDMYTRMGDKETAQKEMKALVDQYPNDMNYKLMYGNMLYQAGQTDEAIEIFRNILDEEPDNIRAQMQIWMHYANADDKEKEDSVARILLRNKNIDSDMQRYVMAQVISENEKSGGDSTKVLEYFDIITGGMTKDADMMMMMAYYMNLKGMARDSINDVYEKVLLIAPDNAAARLQLVAHAYRNDDYDTTIRLCAAARQYNPEEMAFYYYQGIAYIQKEQNDSALEAFHNGIDVIEEDSDPELVSDFYSIMGHLLWEKGLKDKAFASYDSALVWKKDNIEVMNNFAYFLSLEGRELNKAEKMSRKTITEQPDNGTYLDTYAWILFMLERYAEAKAYILQALNCDTTSNCVITEHAGDIFAVLGDIDKALEYWNEALVDNPDNKTLRKKIKRKKYIKE